MKWQSPLTPPCCKESITLLPAAFPTSQAVGFGMQQPHSRHMLIGLTYVARETIKEPGGPGGLGRAALDERRVVVLYMSHGGSMEGERERKWERSAPGRSGSPHTARWRESPRTFAPGGKLYQYQRVGINSSLLRSLLTLKKAFNLIGAFSVLPAFSLSL